MLAYCFIVFGCLIRSSMCNPIDLKQLDLNENAVSNFMSSYKLPIMSNLHYSYMYFNCIHIIVFIITIVSNTFLPNVRYDSENGLCIFSTNI